MLALADGKVRELAGREPSTTNNRMELTAAIEGLRAVQRAPGPVIAHTDSTYVIGGITGWIRGWERRGWRTAEGEPVKNADLWRELDALVKARGPRGVEWRWVKGHAGHDANERCDMLAVSFSRGQPLPLWSGRLLDYPHGSLAPSEPSAVPPRPEPRKKAVPGVDAVYLSLVDGELMRHATWKECEARVKGRSGAKFKKAQSPAEEKAALRAWGLEP